MRRTVRTTEGPPTLQRADGLAQCGSRQSVGAASMQRTVRTTEGPPTLPDTLTWSLTLNCQSCKSFTTSRATRRALAMMVSVRPLAGRNLQGAESAT